ncbi:helix-turn-helix domain-containing protein [Parasphingorhabdus pacifica]
MDVETGAAGRIAQLRKLAGWSQHHLAVRAFVSTSLVKKVEQGRTPPSPSFVASCARALGVETAALYGMHELEFVSDRHAERAGVDELRAALHAYDDLETSESPWSPAELERQLAQAEKLRSSFRYERLCQRMPQLLGQLYARCDATAPSTADGEQARGMLHDAYRLVAALGGHFGQSDIAVAASERHVALAPQTGDPLRMAISAYHRSTYFLQSGHFARGIRVLERAHEHVHQSETSDRHAVAVQLHLRSAILAARAGDGAGADQYIVEARALADERVSLASPYHNVNASKLNVDIHWCAVPVEGNDGTTAIARAKQVDIADHEQPERVGHHHIDMARAWLLHGDREKVLTELNSARKANPQQTRRHPAVHETVRALAEADRRATGTLAGFARWAGIRI